MEHQLQKVFKWVKQKNSIDDVAVLMHPDLSGSIVDAWNIKDILFSFTDIMEVTEKDVNNFNLHEWKYAEE